MSNPSFIVRRAEKADARAILECHREAIKAKAISHYSEKIVDSWAPEVNPSQIQQIEGVVLSPDLIYLVAESAEGILGFGIVVLKANELRAVYVRPNRSGQVGTGILKELLKLARVQGVKYLHMDSTVNAAEFYERNGFTSLSKGVHVLSSGQEMDCIKMRIDL